MRQAGELLLRTSVYTKFVDIYGEGYIDNIVSQVQKVLDQFLGCFEAFISIQ